MAIKKASAVSSGTPFFSPADFNNDLALLIEPHTLRENVETTDFYGKPKTEDRVVAQVTVFKNAEQVENGAPGEVSDYTFTHVGLVNALKGSIETGDAIVGLVRKKPGKNGSYWAILDTDSQTLAAVEEYYTEREAQAEADTPDFLK